MKVAGTFANASRWASSQLDGLATYPTAGTRALCTGDVGAGRTNRLTGRLRRQR